MTNTTTLMCALKEDFKKRQKFYQSLQNTVGIRYAHALLAKRRGASSAAPSTRSDAKPHEHAQQLQNVPTHFS
jgi:hypothetical protein